MGRPHVIQVAGEFVFANIASNALDVNKESQKG
jgi:hypothetical protein